MASKKNVFAGTASIAVALSFLVVHAVSALTTSCVGVPTATNITWTASYADGIAPIAFLWGNGSTSTVQTIAVSPGMYSMTLQTTDASSTMATTTCSTTVVATSTGGNGGNTLAMQVQNLLNQIAALRAQLIQLLKQRGGTGGVATSTPIVTCIKFNRDLKFGDEGDEVRSLQRHLADQDSTLFPRALITGFFGKKTENALRHMQMKWGVGTSTGFFGPRTRGLLNGHCGNEHSVLMSTKKWMTTATSSQKDDDERNWSGRGNPHNY
ncbi:MAG: peptidoglycan-binding protein [Nitrososphaera sp.]|nr:peptidoglycan-binding protein [Nitrososphaera sp.]